MIDEGVQNLSNPARFHLWGGHWSSIGKQIYAGMAELADAQDLGSCEAIRVGSTPTTRTK